ncbi:MAG: flagellar basal body protein, partial [Amphiplicatus sp.]
MLGELKLLTMASALARHSAARHEVLAENIANADTAGYRAKDIEPFEQTFMRAASSTASASAPLDRFDIFRAIARRVGVGDVLGKDFMA